MNSNSNSNSNSNNDGKAYTINGTGHIFHMPDPAQTRIEGTAQYAVFNVMLEAVNSCASKKATILQDADLSVPGKERRILPEYQKAFDLLAAAYIRIAELDAIADHREAALFALPKLDPGHVACAVEDAECRAWYRNLSLAERTSVLEQLRQSADGAKRFLRLQIALLRSPVPLPNDWETEAFGDLWKQTKRLDNPAEAVAIDAERAASAWAVRGLNFLFGILMMVSQWSRAALLSWLIADETRVPAAGAMGFGALDIAEAQRAKQASTRISVTA